MNREVIDSRTQALINRANAAQALAAEIEKLESADPYRIGGEISLTLGGDCPLSVEMIRRIISEGRVVVLADMRNRLENLLSGT